MRGLTRREILAQLAWLATVPVAAAAAGAAGADGERPLYLGAHANAAGSSFVSGFDDAGDSRFDLVLPARGHALAVHPRRDEAVLFARRPGRTALVIDLRRGRPVTTIEAAPGRHFCGHGVYTGDGALLCATEEIGDEGRGVVGRYDPGSGYRRVGESSSHGVGPHEMTVLEDGRTLAVANGGIVTHPDAPGVKLDLDRMQSSVVLLDSRDDRLLASAALPAPLDRLSLRHLAVGRGDLLAVAAQDEGDPGGRVPLVAVWRGRDGLQMLDAGPAVLGRMRGYCGGAAVDAAGRVLGVSCPRGGLVVFWDLETRRLIDVVDVPDGCGLAAADEPGTFLASSGRGGVLRVDPGERRRVPLPSRFVAQARWDNHLAVSRPGSR